MLGWHISVFRQANGGSSSATPDSAHGARIAVWQTAVGGLDWLDALVTASKAIDLGGTGPIGPFHYTARAEHLLPAITTGPPEARATWMRDKGDVVTDWWEGKTVIDADAVNDCSLDEWLLVVVWDES